ncbi:MAG: hypothetical protein Kow0059_11380 [Candidatus Sumerlaeia bacterium]
MDISLIRKQLEAFGLSVLLVGALLMGRFQPAVAADSSSPAPPPPLDVIEAESDPMLDGLLAPRKRGFLGADGAASVPLGGGRVLWIFGDTLLGTQRDGKREGPIVHNTIAIQTTTQDGPGEATFYWDLTDRVPGDFFHPPSFDAPFWYWPGTGLMHEGRVYVFLTRVVRDAGSGGFAFLPGPCVLVRVNNPSAPPDAWRLTWTEMGVGDGHFNINAGALIEGEWVYLLGYDDGPDDKPEDRAAILARMPLAALDAPDPGGALEFWSDGRTWRPRPDALLPLFRPGMTESSLTFDPVRRRYIAVVIKPFTPDLCLVSAESLTGPWSEPQKIFNIPCLSRHNSVHAYAGRAHPELSSSPDELIITYVCNTTDFWSMFGMMDIYYPRFVRVGLAPAGAALNEGR